MVEGDEEGLCNPIYSGRAKATKRSECLLLLRDVATCFRATEASKWKFCLRCPVYMRSKKRPICHSSRSTPLSTPPISSPSICLAVRAVTNFKPIIILEELQILNLRVKPIFLKTIFNSLYYVRKGRLENSHIASTCLFEIRSHRHHNIHFARGE
jgi:hypothetical protein